MFKSRLKLVCYVLPLILISCPAFADGCVKIRSDAQHKTCMKFSPSERKVASKYGLRLGSPFKLVEQQLKQSGWGIDANWQKQNAMSKSPVCGSGWDAVCSIMFVKQDQQIEFILSGSNEGMPLVSIEENLTQAR